jgi:hypothetical protein
MNPFRLVILSLFNCNFIQSFHLSVKLSKQSFSVIKQKQPSVLSTKLHEEEFSFDDSIVKNKYDNLESEFLMNDLSIKDLILELKSLSYQSHQQLPTDSLHQVFELLKKKANGFHVTDITTVLWYLSTLTDVINLEVYIYDNYADNLIIISSLFRYDCRRPLWC